MEAENGRFGEFGGQYVPEALMNAVIELQEAYARYSRDPDFIAEEIGRASCRERV